MSSCASDQKAREIPLCKLAFLCFLTAFMSQVRLSITTQPQPEVYPEKLEWAVWSLDEGNVCGLFLKAVIMVSSPLLSLASTFLLLAGASRRNLYFFFPWLLLTFRGLVAVQTPSLVDAARVALERRSWSEGDQKTLALYLLVLALNASECACFFQIFRMFGLLYAERPTTGKEEREGKQVPHDQEVPALLFDSPALLT